MPAPDAPGRCAVPGQRPGLSARHGHPDHSRPRLHGPGQQGGDQGGHRRRDAGRQLFPGEDPLGKRIAFEFRGNDRHPDAVWREIGVVKQCAPLRHRLQPPYVRFMPLRPVAGVVPAATPGDVAVRADVARAERRRGDRRELARSIATFRPTASRRENAPGAGHRTATPQRDAAVGSGRACAARGDRHLRCGPIRRAADGDRGPTWRSARMGRHVAGMVVGQATALIATEWSSACPRRWRWIGDATCSPARSLDAGHRRGARDRGSSPASSLPRHAGGSARCAQSGVNSLRLQFTVHGSRFTVRVHGSRLAPHAAPGARAPRPF